MAIDTTPRTKGPRKERPRAIRFRKRPDNNKVMRRLANASVEDLVLYADSGLTDATRYFRAATTARGESKSAALKQAEEAADAAALAISELIYRESI